jgi:hypothetical protein
MKLFTIGCSFTEGQDLKYQVKECYTTKLANKLNLKCFNFGSCGASNDYIFRKVFKLINSNTISKDDILIIQWTNYIRKELPIIYKNKNWYYYPPNTKLPMCEKMLFDSINSVKDEHDHNDMKNDLYYLGDKNNDLLDVYSLNFLQEEYQLNTTINYINSLYTYLEYYGFKHIHFFGWDKCIIDSVFDKKVNFMQETFGGYTKTKGNEHPNKKGHEIWAEFLNKKIIEFKFVNEFENQINDYQKNLAKLKVEIEEEIPILFKNRMERLKIEFENEINNSNKKLRKEKEKELEEEINKIRIKKELEMENSLIDKQNELDKIEKQLKEKIDKNKKTKTLI